MKFASNQKCCSVKRRTLQKLFNEVNFSLSQEVYDALPHIIQLCTNMYMYSKKPQTVHDTVIEDDSIGNNVTPTNNIENSHINDPEVINKNCIINDDIIDHDT